jgi:LPS-assembly lipoprotein
MRRLRLPALLLTASLTACGFHPVYAPASSEQAARLGAIFVDIIPNRTGQLLRQALQQRLEGSDGDIPKRFELGVLYGINGEALGTQADNSTTRQRDVATAIWSLRNAGPGGKQITTGRAHAVDGFNVIDEQFFYSDLAEDASQHRLAEALADQITQAIGIYFRAHPG